MFICLVYYNYFFPKKAKKSILYDEEIRIHPQNEIIHFMKNLWSIFKKPSTILKKKVEFSLIFRIFFSRASNFLNDARNYVSKSPQFFYVKTNLYQHITILLTKFFFVKSCPKKKSSLRIITSANYQNDLRKKRAMWYLWRSYCANSKKKMRNFFFRETNTTSLPFRVLMYKMKKFSCCRECETKKNNNKIIQKKNVFCWFISWCQEFHQN